MITLLAATTENPGVLENIQATFGLNPPFFIAQVVNFFLVIFVLKKFAFGPVQTMLEQRRSRIAAGEEKLKLIETQLAESEASTAAAIAKANAEATRLINEANASAQQILVKAEAAAQAERAAIKAELKAEFGRLVAATTSQVTGKVLTADDQKRINDEALTKVEA